MNEAEAIERYFGAVRSLRAALLVTEAREVPVARWRRHGGAWDASAGAAHVSRALRSFAAGLGRLGFEGGDGRLTLEVDDAVALVAPVSDAVTGIFVFSGDTPLGLVRLHVDRLCAQVRPHLARALAAIPPRDPAEAPPPGPAPAPVEAPPEPAPAPVEAPPPEPVSLPEPPSTPAEVSPGPSTDPMRPDRVPHTSRYESEPPAPEEESATEGNEAVEERRTASRPPSDRPPRSRTDVPMATGATREDEPSPRSRTDVPMAPVAGSTPVTRTTESGKAPEAAEEEVVSVPPPPSMPTGTDPPPAVAEEPAEKTRGERLLDHLERYAPDAHAALLRVSLQTGLPMALLRTPERMSDDEVEQVEASVQRILGSKELPY